MNRPGGTAAVQLDHPIVLVEEEQVEREAHAEGVDAAAARDQQARAGALAAEQERRPSRRLRRVVATGTVEAEQLGPLEARGSAPASPRLT